MSYPNTLKGARTADQEDSLATLRDEFLFPKNNDRKVLYFTGNSLGLQPRKAREILNEELDDWARWGVDGHLEAHRPWVAYHEFFTQSLAKIVGAKETEVVAMNGLTTNLHLLMVSFFRPEGKRCKILCEGKAFPSDQYALKSQLRFHGLDPEECLIEIEPDPETELIEDDRVIEAIDAHRDEIALVMLGGVNYYTGQVFDMERITDAAKRAGAIVGWDLAHGAGNVHLELHKWGADFAAWCGYKYLNSGPGGISGVFIHERHHGQTNIPRFEGWWGHNKEERFKMDEHFDPIPTAEAWQLSNAPVLSMAPLLASLELFDQVGMPALQAKSKKLTAYLQLVIEEAAANSGQSVRIITPTDENRRGCQISIAVPGKGRAVFESLSEAGVIADWREPDVIRLAPVPMYNSFEDVYEFGQLLEKYLKA